MSKKKNDKTISEALDDFLSLNGLKEKALAQRAISDWELVMGKPIADQTGKIWFAKGILYVEIKHPVWKQELLLGRSKIVEMINRHLGADLIQEIKLI